MLKFHYFMRLIRLLNFLLIHLNLAFTPSKMKIDKCKSWRVKIQKEMPFLHLIFGDKKGINRVCKYACVWQRWMKKMIERSCRKIETKCVKKVPTLDGFSFTFLFPSPYLSSFLRGRKKDEVEDEVVRLLSKNSSSWWWSSSSRHYIFFVSTM